MKEAALIIFQKNFISGNVKTRIAAETDNETALSIYKLLCQITDKLTESEHWTCVKYFSDFVPDDQAQYLSQIQKGIDLGERMSNALQQTLSKFTKAVLIGTDCPYIKHEDLKRAFTDLDKHDLVLGPSKDGGYYLIGMKELHPELFADIPWSTSEVYSITHNIADHLNLRVCTLNTYEDIDQIKHWESYLESGKS